MNMNRRDFVELTAGAGLISILPGCKATIGKPHAHSNPRQVSPAELEKAADTPVLKLDGLDSPLVIDSIELLRKGREYIVTGVHRSRQVERRRRRRCRNQFQAGIFAPDTEQAGDPLLYRQRRP